MNADPQQLKVEQEPGAKQSITVNGRVEEPSNTVRIFFIILLAGYFVFLFSSVICSDRDFILRDVGRYFMNFFREVQEEWEAGRIPLWTPYDNGGTPLLGNPCTAVMYPPKILFFLPQSFEDNLKTFILFHFAITLISTWMLAGYLKLSLPARFITTCSFVFSSPVLFGYCNIPFLCSTSWLPLAILFGLKLIYEPSFSTLVKLGVMLSLMVLCGDPQAAYHTGLVLAFAVPFCIHRKKSARDISLETVAKADSFWKAYAWLLGSAVLAGGIAAVQIIPTVEYSRLSTRNTSITPENIWQVPSFLMHKQQYHPKAHWYDTFIGNPVKPAKHHDQIYSFSYSPLRILEWFTPGIYGNVVQPHLRWTCRWGLEENFVWFPSVASGVIVYILALLSLTGDRMQNETWNRMIRWLKWMTILSLVASFGRYGLYAFFHYSGQWAGFISWEKPLAHGGEVGGIYWLMNLILPGYSGFRYPSKWLIMTFLGIAILAGFGSQKLLSQQINFRKLKIYIIFAGSISMLSFLLTTGIINLTETQSSNVAPLSSENINHLIISSISAVFFYAVCFCLFMYLSKKICIPGTKKHGIAVCLLILTASIEVICVNRQMVLSSPRGDWKTDRLYASEIIRKNEAATNKSIDTQIESTHPPRFYAPLEFSLVPVNASELDSRVRSLPSKDKINFIDAMYLRINRDALSGMVHHEEHLSTVCVPVTIDHECYFSQFESVPLNQDGSQYVQPRRAYDLWGTKYFIQVDDAGYPHPSISNFGMEKAWGENRKHGMIPTGKLLQDLTFKYIEIPRVIKNLKIIENTDAYPLCRIVHHVEVIPEIHPLDIQKRKQLHYKLFFDAYGGFDHDHSAVIETNRKLELLDANKNASSAELKNEFANIVHYDPQRITLDVQLEEPGLIIIAELYYPGWVCRVKKTGNSKSLSNEKINESASKTVVIEKVNNCMRGVMMYEAGQYQVEFTYEPNSFYLGAGITLFSIVSTLLVFFYLMIERSHRNNAIAKNHL